MKTKLRMRLEIKEISPEGTFEGMLSPYGNVDRGGDLIERGAYVKTLKDQGPTRPMLWQHDTSMPIGELTLEDRTDGLWCKGQLLMALPEAQKAYLLIKARIVKGLSIGFEAVKDAIENGVRRLKEIRLYEGSIVTFPMNEAAIIHSVKGEGETKGDFNEEFAGIQLRAAGYQMLNALQNALDDLNWADLTKDEKLTAAEVVIQQFTDAYLAYLPAFLDTIAQDYFGMEMMAARAAFETKAGRTFSASNYNTISAEATTAKTCMDTILALLTSAADTADKSVAATGQAKAAIKTEPVDADHSAAAQILTKLRALIPAA